MASPGPSYEQIRYEVTDPVATITLNRPDQLNAWTAQMEQEVAAALRRAEADPKVVGVVLTGAGRGFCAGADIGMLADFTSEDRDATDRTGSAEAIISGGVAESDRPGDRDAPADLRGTYTYLMSMRKPVIAAINGAVAGMGVPIALACDLRFMSSEAVLTTAFAQRGLIAEWGVSWQLGRLVGPAVALDLLFSARKVRGDEAERLGLVNRSLPADEVLRAAQDYIGDLARNCSPRSLAVMKRQVYSDLLRGLRAAEEAAEQLMVDSFGRPDFTEGVQSYLDRRPPSFPRVAER